MPRKDTTSRKPRLRAVAPSKPRPEADTLEVHTPDGWRPSDPTAAMTAEDNAHAYAGLYEGDTAVIYQTDDVRPDDLAAVRIDGEIWLGHYRTAPGGYFTFEQDGALRRFRPGTAVLFGRVCHFERRGEVVRRFRPIR